MVSVGIVGASGMVGKYLTTGFLNNNSYKVTLLSRKGGNSAALKPYEAKGAKIVEADFDNEAGLAEALKGLEIVVSAVGAAALPGQSGIIKAAKAAGVKRFVPSEFGMDTTAPGIREYFPALGYKYAIQDELQASGLEWTYFTTGFFLETSFSDAFYFDVPNGKAVVKGNPDATFTVTSLEDIARWTAAALLDPASKNANVYLKGEDVTYNSAIKTIEAATGKKLDVTYVSKEQLDKDIAAAPHLFAAFIDLLIKAVTDGWCTVPDGKKWAGQDAPRKTLSSFVKEGRWSWGS